MDNSMRERVEALLDRVEPVIGLALTNEALAAVYDDVVMRPYAVINAEAIRNTIEEGKQYALCFSDALAELTRYREELIEDGDTTDANGANTIMSLCIFMKRMDMSVCRTQAANETMNNLLNVLEHNPSAFDVIE